MTLISEFKKTKIINGEYAPANTIHILYIEEAPKDFDCTQSILTEDHLRNYIITHAIDFHEATAAIPALNFDIILLSLSVSNETGLSALHEILDLLTFDNLETPIIILTSLSDELYGEQAIADGAADFLPKAHLNSINLSRSIRFAMERHQLRQKLLEQARTDGLTGLNNRAETFRLCQNQLEQCQRNKIPIALGILDLNDFKHVNDNFGHQMGDEILKFVGGRLLQSTRASDIVGRIGGDEFLVLITNFNSKAALNSTLFNLKNKVEQSIGCSVDGQTIQMPITISIGMTIYHPPSSLKKTMAIADKAMYLSKAQGGILIFL